MDEQNSTLEQPNCDLAPKTEESQMGSISGKFKSSTALLQAYENLQAEFTKKCQKLSELEKKSCDNEEKTEKPSNSSPQNLGEPAPKPTLKQKLDQFLQESEDAKNYLPQMAEFLLEHEDLREKEDAITLAYLSAVKAKSPEKSSPLTSEDAREQVLKMYISELANRKTPPVLCGDMGVATKSAISTPNTLAEAKTLAKALLG